MRVEDLDRLFRIHGYETRTRGEEVLIGTCLFCANPRYNLEVSASKGVYHCWACNAGGAAASLLRRIGAEAPDDLEVRVGEGYDDPGSAYVERWPPMTVSALDQRSAISYLESRGVSEAEARWLDVGVQLSGQWTPRIVFPLTEYWSGRDVGYVSRAYAGAGGPRYLTEFSCPESLPGWRRASGGYDGIGDRVHVVVEGIFDALAVRRAGFGVAILLGVGRHDAALRWACRVPEDEEIAIMLDGTAADEAEALRWKLSEVRGRVRTVPLLAEEDPGSKTAEEIGRLVRREVAR